MHSGLLEFFDKFLAATMEDNAPQVKTSLFLYMLYLKKAFHVKNFVYHL